MCCWMPPPSWAWASAASSCATPPPIRDWVWWKNKEAVLTIGDDKPRYQQDGGQGRSEPPEGRRRFLGLF